MSKSRQTTSPFTTGKTTGVIEAAEGVRELFYDFAEYIRGKGAAPVTAEESFALTRACLEARQPIALTTIANFNM